MYHSFNCCIKFQNIICYTYPINIKIFNFFFILGILENIEAKNSNISMTGSVTTRNVGGLLGLISNTTATNCSSNNIRISASGSSNLNQGGISGNSTGSTFLNCSSSYNILTSSSISMDIRAGKFLFLRKLFS